VGLRKQVQFLLSCVCRTKTTGSVSLIGMNLSGRLDVGLDGGHSFGLNLGTTPGLVGGCG
jgi:hypothetical protein